MLKTAICDLFGIQYPIIQGGMTHLATAEVVSAVSNAGGLGIIGAAYYPPDWVKQQIHSTRQLTDKPFGVNIIMRSPFIEQVVDVILEEEIAVVTTGAGSPKRHMSELKKAGVKVVPVVASVALARQLEQAGAAAVVAEGAESGGHIGETTTMALVPQVVDGVQMPVIAAGGIADGRGLMAALALGAQGVQIGTRFICSQECIAHPKYKEKLLEADDRATVIIGRSAGQPLRCLQNKLARQLSDMEEAGISAEELSAFRRGRAYQGEVEGDVDQGLLVSGQIAGLIKEIKPVKAIIDEIMAQAESIIDGLGNLCGEN